jgi:hypothetical protein
VYIFGGHAGALYNAEAIKSAIFAAQPTPTAETNAQILSRYEFGSHQKPLYDAEALKSRAWSPLAAAEGFILWNVLSGPEELDLSSTVYGRVFPAVAVPPPIISSNIVRPIISIPPQIDPNITWSRVWEPLTSPIYGTTVKPFAPVPPQVDPNVVWSRVWETVVTPEILGATIRPLPPVPPQVDPNVTWMRAWPAVAVPPPILGGTVRPIFFVPGQRDTNVPYSLLWTPSIYAPGPPPPVGYLTIYEAINELATEGYIADPVFIYEYSTVVPNNYVIELVTVPGLITQPIRLVVSLGPPNPGSSTTIPNVVGQELTFAQQNIVAASCGLGTVTYLNNALANGIVFDQIPPATGIVPLWTQINLYVSSGPLVTYPGGNQPVVPV